MGFLDSLKGTPKNDDGERLYLNLSPEDQQVKSGTTTKPQCAGALKIYRGYLCFTGLLGVVASLIIIGVCVGALVNDEMADVVGPVFVFSPHCRNVLKLGVFLGVMVFLFSCCFTPMLVWKFNRKWLRCQFVLKLLLGLGFVGCFIGLCFAVLGQTSSLHHDWINTYNHDPDLICFIQKHNNCTGWTSNSTRYANVDCSDVNTTTPEQRAAVLAKQGCKEAVQASGLALLLILLVLYEIVEAVVQLPTTLITMWVQSQFEAYVREAALNEAEERERASRKGKQL